MAHFSLLTCFFFFFMLIGEIDGRAQYDEEVKDTELHELELKDGGEYICSVDDDNFLVYNHLIKPLGNHHDSTLLTYTQNENEANFMYDAVKERFYPSGFASPTPFIANDMWFKICRYYERM
eukprot:CAMPEP_0198249804 /NCGR_PEP_ID=MMETSP1447-20131203/1204_1 /TAXON_ID=420782 /ORGANISM="Chaetoceros dichaeta, Strain CCMP1751" /LENGTH=121 /DNA_ID=CAMNT_0043934517 /DNA_START=11 /DNA_END=376 /DNA_ORIENTATION=+